MDQSGSIYPEDLNVSRLIDQTPAEQLGPIDLDSLDDLALDSENSENSENSEKSTDSTDSIDKITNNGIIETTRTDVAIIVSGSVDSGKSSVLGVLTTNKLDDGNGSARKFVAKHQHEIDAGKTSDISTRTLKLENGKMVTFIDVAGHEKYLKTSIYAFVGHFPDYAIVTVSPLRGILKMTKEHMGILINMGVPIVVVITHIDDILTNPDSYELTVSTLKKLFSRSNKSLRFINSDDEAKLAPHELLKKEETESSQMIQLAEDMSSNQHIIPVISISNKTGYYISVLKSLLFNLKPRQIWKEDSTINGSIFYIDSTFAVDGVGLVISGIVKGKTIKTGDTLWIGPRTNDFVEVVVRSIHNNNKEKINELHNEHKGCFAIRVVDKKSELARNNIIKGMVAVTSVELQSQIAYRFKAKIEVLNHSTTICNKYSPVIHCGTVRQTARIIMPDEQTLKTRDVAEVGFKFKQRPEFLEIGSVFFFREGLTKGTGTILEITPLTKDSDPYPDKNGRTNQRRRHGIRQKKKILNII